MTSRQMWTPDTPPITGDTIREFVRGVLAVDERRLNEEAAAMAPMLDAMSAAISPGAAPMNQMPPHNWESFDTETRRQVGEWFVAVMRVHEEAGDEETARHASWAAAAFGAFDDTPEPTCRPVRLRQALFGPDPLPR